MTIDHASTITAPERTFACRCNHTPSRHHRRPTEFCTVCLSCGGDVMNRRGCCNKRKPCPCNQLDCTPSSGPADSA